MLRIYRVKNIPCYAHTVLRVLVLRTCRVHFAVQLSSKTFFAQKSFSELGSGCAGLQ